jgi:predicted ATPase
MALVSGPDLFVGRERKMAELIAALDGALDGRGGLVMLAGQLGIGKTRLTEELLAVAHDRGAVVTLGVCYEGGGTPPYWPWIQVIRSLLTEPSEAIKGALETRAAVIAEIVPEIRDILPQLESAPEVDPSQARFRLFDSITSFLNGLWSWYLTTCTGQISRPGKC